MIRTALLTGLLVLAAPAMAQDVQDPSADPSAAQPPAGEMDMQTAPQPDPQATEPQPTEPQSRPASPDEVGGLVQAEFPSRDGDGNGSLDQAEFSAWIGELLARSPNADPSADPQAQAAAAFSQADTNGDGSVSSDEMTALLSRPQ